MSPADTLPRSFRDLYDLVRAVYARFNEDQCLQAAASLTYTVLLSLVPLLTVALALIAAFPVFAEWTTAVEQFMVENLLPEAISEVITSYFYDFSANVGRLTAVGMLALTATALMVMITIDGTFNRIFRVPQPRPLIWQVLIYWAVLTLGPVLLGGSLTMTSYLLTASLGFTSALPIIGEVVLQLVPIALTILALTLMYRIVPNRRVYVRHALIGGCIAGLAFELTKRGFTLYISHFPTYRVIYGAFATIPIFLLWLYLSWVMILLGAVITALLPGYRYSGARRRPPGSRFMEALDILGRLLAAQHEGRAIPLARLAAEARLPPDSCERLLERMLECRWVARTPGDGWVLSRDPEELFIADIYRAFVFAPEVPESVRARAHLDPLLEAHDSGMAGPLNVSLKGFFSKNDTSVLRSARAA